MKICKYCKQPAGLFSDHHKECETKHQNGVLSLNKLMEKCINNPTTSQNYSQEYSHLVIDNFLTNDDIAVCAGKVINQYEKTLHRPISASVLQVITQFLHTFNLSRNDIIVSNALICLSQKIIKCHIADFFTEIIDITQLQTRINKTLGVLPISTAEQTDVFYYMLNKAADNFLKDGQMKKSEETLINTYITAFGLQTTNLPAAYQTGNIPKIAQTTIINNLQMGIVPPTPSFLPIVLTKGESLLWTYNNTTLYQEKIEKEFVGRRGGFSIPVFKGISYRTGRFKGKPVEHSYMNNLGNGTLYITNKNLIFQSPTKAAKVSFDKLIGITPYSDGIELHKEGDSKRMVLQGFDSWFVMSLLQVINQ